MFNPVTPYRYLLPTMYLCMCRYRKSKLVLCGGRTWICLHITRLYEVQRQPSSESALPACPKTVNRAPIAGGFDTNCTAVCNRRDSSTDYRLCWLEAGSFMIFHSFNAINFYLSVGVVQRVCRLTWSQVTLDDLIVLAQF